MKNMSRLIKVNRRRGITRAETALRRAQTEGASVVLGSATPSMEAVYRAKNGEYVLMEMKNRSKNAGSGRGLYGGYAERIEERKSFDTQRTTAKTDERAA